MKSRISKGSFNQPIDLRGRWRRGPSPRCSSLIAVRILEISQAGSRLTWHRTLGVMPSSSTSMRSLPESSFPSVSPMNLTGATCYWRSSATTGLMPPLTRRARKKGQRRLDDPRDFVRIEIETALDRGIRVVPLLVGQRPAMPSKADLPDTLKALVDRQALVIQSGPDFRGQADRLIRRLETEQFEAKKEKLQQDVQKAIDIANQAPKMALSGGREVLELIMQDVYRRRFSEPPGHRSLEVLTERLTEEGHLPDQLGFGAMLRTLSGAGTARWSERITGESVLADR